MNDDDPTSCTVVWGSGDMVTMALTTGAPVDLLVTPQVEMFKKLGMIPPDRSPESVEAWLNA